MAYRRMIHRLIFTQIETLKDRKALFLDRDGVINKKPKTHEYVRKWSDFRFNSGIFELVEKANELDYLVVVVTNQRGIARGLHSHEDFIAITNKMLAKFRSRGAYIDAVYYCPHDYGDSCKCRKPKPGLFLQAIRDFNINPSRSIMIGDSAEDVTAAQKAGVAKTIKTKSDIIDIDISSLLVS